MGRCLPSCAENVMALCIKHGGLLAIGLDSMIKAQEFVDENTGKFYCKLYREVMTPLTQSLS